MLSYVLWTLLVISLLSAAFTGNFPSLAPAALDGAQQGITLTLSMGGALCLWSGLLEVLERAGVTRRLARITLPLLRRLIRPKAPSIETEAALSGNFAANLLGLGNAATPAGLRAVSLLQEEGDRDAVNRLILLNTCSVQLIPFTAASLRSAAGAQSPFAILPVVWIASLISVMVSFWVYRRLAHA